MNHWFRSLRHVYQACTVACASISLTVTMLQHSQAQHASGCQQSRQKAHGTNAVRCMQIQPPCRYRQLAGYAASPCRRHQRAAAVQAQPDNSGQPLQPHQAPSPTLWDGVNWYCYTALGLLFLTDFTPAGQWLLAGAASGAAAGRLVLLQWGVFVLPTLAWMRSKGWDLKSVLQLNSFGTPRQLLTGVAAGPVLWILINVALAIKTGNADALLGTAAAAAGSSSSVGGSSPSALLLGGATAGGLAQLPQLLLTAAVSPAVAEELLFRGFLLTAVQERLGRIDAVAVSAALFALIHLDPQQFFLYCVLGGAAGAAAVSSRSLGPAVALHLGFNAAAVTAGFLLHH